MCLAGGGSGPPGGGRIGRRPLGGGRGGEAERSARARGGGGWADSSSGGAREQPPGWRARKQAVPRRARGAGRPAARALESGSCARQASRMASETCGAGGGRRRGGGVSARARKWSRGAGARARARRRAAAADRRRARRRPTQHADARRARIGARAARASAAGGGGAAVPRPAAPLAGPTCGCVRRGGRARTWSHSLSGWPCVRCGAIVGSGQRRGGEPAAGRRERRGAAKIGEIGEICAPH